MRPHPRLCFLALLGLLWVRGAAADPAGPHLYVVPFGGFTVFDGTLRFPTRTLRDMVNAGARVGYQWHPWFGAEGAIGYTPTREDLRQGGRDASFMHASGAYTITPYGGGLYGAPFILLGAGTHRLKISGGGLDSTLSEGHVQLGGGLNFWITDAIGARIEARDLISLKQNEASKTRMTTLIFGVGLTYAIGAKARDSDGDGVPDRLDQSPNTPKGAVVDARGVPLDTDGDGVFDGIDKQPNTPKGATVDAFGVAHDADGDGVFDGIDTCADTPQGARVDEKGCPSDQDKDGVLDGIDQCADTPAGFPVDEKGCPKDQDKDGVSDDRDKCPDTAAGATVDSTGCVPVLAEVTSELDSTGKIRLDLPSFKETQFETGKSAIPAVYLPRLDAIGQLLTQRPELKIEVAGHTDSRGAAGTNLKLSAARAKAVYDYLVKSFPNIKPERLSVRGYGESKPLVPDTSPENMAINRRVEFVVLNREALQQSKPSGP